VAEVRGESAPSHSQGEASSVNTSLLFAELPLAISTAIKAAGRTKVFPRGELLFLKGDCAYQVLLLTSGVVKNTQLGSSGTEVIVRLSSPGDVLGATGALSRGMYESTAQAFRSCRALTWEARVFRNFADQYPVLRSNLVSMLGRDLRELEERFHEIATEKVAFRVARQLIRLEGKIGHLVGNAIQIDISREELAQMTGTTLFTVSRFLSTWEVKGAVTPSRQTVVIRDHNLLLSVSGQG
jgi:CRP/FNR family transcriptional regulator, nitrogen oxide reductase regulator